MDLLPADRRQALDRVELLRMGEPVTRVLPGAVDLVEDEQIGDVIEQQRRDHLVDAELDLEDRRRGDPQEAADQRKDQHQPDPRRRRAHVEDRDHRRPDRTPEELALDPDVPEIDAERDRGAQPHKNQRAALDQNAGKAQPVEEGEHHELIEDIGRLHSRGEQDDDRDGETDAEAEGDEGGVLDASDRLADFEVGTPEAAGAERSGRRGGGAVRHDPPSADRLRSGPRGARTRPRCGPG